ncbi:MAG: hypothetical protein M1819_005561 [Sarea resinae]|nr:MAG: hypothetical protein M1819_005561 [Sarea resinae]
MGDVPSSFPSPHSSYPASFPESVQANSKLDEGYSEETRSQNGSDEAMRPDSNSEQTARRVPAPKVTLPNWILVMNETDRMEFGYAVVRSLRTSSVAAIVERLDPLLHLDPVSCLPPELTSEIFSYLDPSTLLKASMASRAWRERTLDSRLWKQLYGFEGWGVETQQVHNFEQEYTYPDRTVSQRMRKLDADAEQPGQIKRMRPRRGSVRKRRRAGEGGLFGGNERPQSSSSEGPDGWNEQHGIVEADDNYSTLANAGSVLDARSDEMQDVEYQKSATSSDTRPSIGSWSLVEHEPSPNSQISTSAEEDNMYPSPTLSEQEATSSVPPLSLSPAIIEPSLVLRYPFSTPKINWHYLYKQRRRLEDNWNAGRFTNFQLPHPEHAYEAHRECVYTIQYSGRHLVSGSRDRTVRIWDLDTRRLMKPPLVGHTGSVLCLQFDDSKEEDIIVSGSSDTDVILWRFSTGEMIKKLEHAHNESVLNLRFDKTFLVTCSKDKTIKVWNRKELDPEDKDYPKARTASANRFPPYIISMEILPSLYAGGQLIKKHKPLPTYSLLMTLDGHGAAVNAIQVYEDQIVSASGDRTIKVWDIHTGDCLKTLPGHKKGIACVQFDGRRIVSGSSDNTVMIFDHVTGGDVGTLEGHSNLVRTVQAGFGDLPGNEDDLRAEAEAVDREFFRARQRGVIPNTNRKGQPRNAGSRNPRDITTIGAKIPPGGGGSRWGRIVSGSYDETVIIWRRNEEGKWVISKRLRQEDAVRAAAGPRHPDLLAPVVTTTVNHQQHNLMHNGQATAPVAGTVPNGATGAVATGHPHHPAPHGQPGSQANVLASQTGQHVPHTLYPGLHAALHPNNQPGQANIGTALGHFQVALNQGGQNGTQTQHQQQTTQAHPHPVVHAHHQAAPADVHSWHEHFPTPAPHNQQSNFRVFKLQFDSRRIICCSQDPRIVGWDFANGDEKIMEASKFFSGP